MSTEQTETTMPATLAAALVALQAKLPQIRKTKTAKIEKKAGGHFTYRYADLGQVSRVMLPLLAGVGLCFTSRPTVEAGEFVLVYELLHVSGDSRGGVFPIRRGTPQEVGSELTYARRQALCAVTGMAPDDDDDDAATSSQRAAASKTRPEWDPADQAVLYDGWLAEIEASKDVETLAGVGRRINAASNNGELSPVTHAKLRAEGARRNVELSQDETPAVGEVTG